MRDDIGLALRCGSCGVGQVRGAEAREGHSSDMSSEQVPNYQFERNRVAAWGYAAGGPAGGALSFFITSEVKVLTRTRSTDHGARRAVRYSAHVSAVTNSPPRTAPAWPLPSSAMCLWRRPRRTVAPSLELSVARDRLPDHTPQADCGPAGRRWSSPSAGSPCWRSAAASRRARASYCTWWIQNEREIEPGAIARRERRADGEQHTSLEKRGCGRAVSACGGGETNKGVVPPSTLYLFHYCFMRIT